MTNSEVLKKFSEETGITDPVVEQIVRHQESCVYKDFDKNIHTVVNTDEGNGESYTIFEEECFGIWPSWEESKRDQQYDRKKYVNGDWTDHRSRKTQEKLRKSTKTYNYYDGDMNWDKINSCVDDLMNGMKDEFNKFTWPNGRGVAFGDDEEYIDAEWREVDKPLMLPPHEEEKDV